MLLVHEFVFNSECERETFKSMHSFIQKSISITTWPRLYCTLFCGVYIIVGGLIIFLYIPRFSRTDLLALDQSCSYTWRNRSDPNYNKTQPRANREHISVDMLYVLVYQRWRHNKQRCQRWFETTLRFYDVTLTLTFTFLMHECFN